MALANPSLAYTGPVLHNAALPLRALLRMFVRGVDDLSAYRPRSLVARLGVELPRAPKGVPSRVWRRRSAFLSARRSDGN